jgi:hypothetical protein
MPKPSTLPTLYNDCKVVSISDLKRWGYLKPNQFNSGIITWSRNGNKTGSISISVYTYLESPFIELNYQCNNEQIKYQVELETLPSNLGKGVVWFFICPRTGSRCRKLHLVNTYFYHRSAFKGCLYEKQTYSHKTRNLYKFFEVMFPKDKTDKQVRPFYAGKPTKRFIKSTDSDKKTWYAAKKYLESNPFF